MTAMSKLETQHQSSGATTPQPESASKGFAKKFLNKKAAVLVIIAVVIIGAGLYFAHKNSNENSSNSTPYASTTYKVEGSSSGNAIFFHKPSEFKNPQPGSVSTYKNFLQKNSQMHVIARLTATTRQFSAKKGPSPKYADTLRSVLNSNPDVTSDKYKTATRTISTFVENGYQNKVSAHLSAPSSFTNSYISKDAWQFDTTVTPSSNSSKSKITPQQGKAIIVIGKRGYYMLMISFDKSKWDSSHTEWQKVLDSVKIDQ